LAALFVLVAGHSGFRPVELRGAAFEGNVLILPNAKKRPGQSRTRTLNLSDLHADVRTGIDLLLALIDHDLTKAEFAKWQKCLAGQLERACKRVGIRVLSLYSFRHVAIASWAAAGLSVQEIALLCGHLSIRTAHTHYARASVGHKRKALARAGSMAQFVPELATGKSESKMVPEPPIPAPTEAVTSSQRTGFVIEDMPEPVFKPDISSPPLSRKEVRQYLDSLIDPRDPSEIAANIARARRRREARDRARHPDQDHDGPGSNKE